MSFTSRRVKEEKASKRSALVAKLQSAPWGKIIMTTVSVSKPAVGFYKRWRVRHDVEVKRQRHANLLKKVMMVLIAILIALVFMVGALRAMMSVRELTMGDIVTAAGAELTYDEQGYLNLLLIGQGDDDHDGKDLTDTIIVASVDPTETNSVVLLSIPRDVYFLSTEKMGKGKVNSLYRDYKSFLRFRQGKDESEASIETLRELGDEVGRKLGLDIQHVIKVNFSAFIEAVDAVGGIEVDVPIAIDDQEYPDENYGYEPFQIEKGLQTLDGATALKYARTRSTTSDFSRSARQQQIIAALAGKAKSGGYATNPNFIAKMLQNLSRNTETTMTLREMMTLAELAQDLDRERVITMQLNDRNALYDGFIEPGGLLYTPPRDLFKGVSVLLPVSIPEFPVTWKQPKAFVKLLTNTRNAYLANASINVLNNGARSGSARRLATELIRYGFTVNEIANAELPNEQIESIVIARDETFTALNSLFAALLGFTPTTVPPELAPVLVGDITIILGENYEYTPLQDLISNP